MRLTESRGYTSGTTFLAGECDLWCPVSTLWRLFLCRNDRVSVFSFSFNLLSNQMIPAGIGVELALILAVVYTAPGNWIFGTAPLPLSVWLFALPFAFGMTILEEGRKYLVRKWRARGP
jgi:sodium/potassium-transporting ATPase subunit alpha